MTSNKVVSNGFGALAALPEELLVDVTTKDCKGCCDDEQFSSSDSVIGTETTTEQEREKREKREKRGESFLDTLTSSSGRSGSRGSSGSSGSSESIGKIRTKSGKTIKDFKSLTIGSLDLGTSGKDCPEQDKIEEKIRNIIPKPDIFFIQNKKGNKIFNEIYTNEFNAKDDKGPQVSVYSNRYLDGTSKTKTASASNPPQSGILYFTNDKYTIANIQLNSKVYKDGIKDLLKKSSKESLTKYNDDFTKYEKELKKLNQAITEYIKNNGTQVDESKYKSELEKLIKKRNKFLYDNLPKNSGGAIENKSLFSKTFF